MFVTLPSNFSNALFQTNGSGRNGGALFISNTITIYSSQFINNVANTGGGIYQATGGGQVANTLMARNRALSNAGMAMYLAPASTFHIFESTIGAPSLNSGDAVRVAGGNVTIEDTIITNHAIGLNRLGGTVFEDYNLFYGNTLSKFGSMTGGTHDVSSDPLFVNPGADNYHIRPVSAAINTGTNVGILNDIDGQTRPQNGGFDTGYDEATTYYLNLPLILR